MDESVCCVLGHISSFRNPEFPSLYKGVYRITWEQLTRTWFSFFLIKQTQYLFFKARFGRGRGDLAAPGGGALNPLTTLYCPLSFVLWTFLDSRRELCLCVVIFPLFFWQWVMQLSLSSPISVIFNYGYYALNYCPSIKHYFDLVRRRSLTFEI